VRRPGVPLTVLMSRSQQIGFFVLLSLLALYVLARTW
jgi:hypothetical protein